MTRPSAQVTGLAVGQVYVSEYGVEYHVLALHEGYVWTKLRYRGAKYEENQPTQPHTYTERFFNELQEVGS